LNGKREKTQTVETRIRGGEEGGKALERRTVLPKSGKKNIPFPGDRPPYLRRSTCPHPKKGRVNATVGTINGPEGRGGFPKRHKRKINSYGAAASLGKAQDQRQKN